VPVTTRSARVNRANQGPASQCRRPGGQVRWIVNSVHAQGPTTCEAVRSKKPLIHAAFISKTPPDCRCQYRRIKPACGPATPRGCLSLMRPASITRCGPSRQGLKGGARWPITVLPFMPSRVSATLGLMLRTRLSSRAGCLIQYQDWCVFQDRPCQRDALTLHADSFTTITPRRPNARHSRCGPCGPCILSDERMRLRLCGRRRFNLGFGSHRAYRSVCCRTADAVEHSGFPAVTNPASDAASFAWSTWLTILPSIKMLTLFPQIRARNRKGNQVDLPCRPEATTIPNFFAPA